jgi:hypothetical protein
MSSDDFVAKAMEQAKELQAKIAQALGESDKLRDTLLEQARQSADVTNEQTKTALDNLESAMKSGSEFLGNSSRRQAKLIELELLGSRKRCPKFALANED